MLGTDLRASKVVFRLCVASKKGLDEDWDFVERDDGSMVLVSFVRSTVLGRIALMRWARRTPSWREMKRSFSAVMGRY